MAVDANTAASMGSGGSARQFPLLAILVVALLVRVAVVLLTVDSRVPEGDLQYDMYATNLLEGKGFRIDGLLSVTGGERPGEFGLDTLYSFKPPLYPAFLAAVYRLMGRNFVAVGLAQAVLGALTCLLAFRVARRIFDGRTAAITAAVLALYPYHVFMVGRVSDTTLFTTLTVASVLLLYRLGQAPSALNGLAAGLVTGLAILCRPNLVFFVPVAALWLLLTTRPGVRAWGSALTFAAGVVLALAPWAARNFRVHEQFVLLGTNGGYTFWQSNNPSTEKHLRMRSDLDAVAFTEGIDWRKQELSKLSEVGQDRWFYRQGLDFVRERPGAFLGLAWLKLRGLWGWTLYPESGGRIKNLAYSLSYGPLLLLAVAGFIAARRFRETSLILGLVAAFSLVYAVFYGKTIYRTPMDPLLFVFSAYCLGRIWELLRRSRQPSGSVTA